jgi:hypothetical protein
MNGNFTAQDFTIMFHTIKNKIEDDQKHQVTKHNDGVDENGEIPTIACFPPYATEPFMKNKMWFILTQLFQKNYEKNEINTF